MAVDITHTHISQILSDKAQNPQTKNDDHRPQLFIYILRGLPRK
jgi:hypothetical protein